MTNGLEGSGGVAGFSREASSELGGRSPAGRGGFVERGVGAVVDVERLSVVFETPRGLIRAVDRMDLMVRAGEICAIVGESGCGKSTFAYALLSAVPATGRIVEGAVRINGQDVMTLPREELDRVRGPEIAMVFQAAMNSFNPVLTIRRQVEDVLEAHRGVYGTLREGIEYFCELLRLVQLSPGRVLDSFESQLSGGMKQRVAIAIALLLRPKILVLDEPTTALDVVNQRLVIEVLRRLHQQFDLTVIFVTHDLAVVAELATRVVVMYAGAVVEDGDVLSVFDRGARRHPYVVALIEAIPSILDGGERVRPIRGQVPNLAELPAGCRFAPRCEFSMPICNEKVPELVRVDHGGHAVACWLVGGAERGSANGEGAALTEGGRL